MGTKWTEERKIAARERMKNFRHTDEAKARMSEVKRNQPKEIGDKISASKMGHSVSQATRDKIRLANTHLNTEEVRDKQRASIIRPDKWPHGYICDCLECKTKKNEYYKNWRKSKEA